MHRKLFAHIQVFVEVHEIREASTCWPLAHNEMLNVYAHIDVGWPKDVF